MLLDASGILWIYICGIYIYIIERDISRATLLDSKNERSGHLSPTCTSNKQSLLCFAAGNTDTICVCAHPAPRIFATSGVGSFTKKYLRPSIAAAKLHGSSFSSRSPHTPARLTSFLSQPLCSPTYLSRPSLSLQHPHTGAPVAVSRTAR